MSLLMPSHEKKATCTLSKLWGVITVKQNYIFFSHGLIFSLMSSKNSLWVRLAVTPACSAVGCNAFAAAHSDRPCKPPNLFPGLHGFSST